MAAAPGWGFCDRHAWGAILGEASYRHGYLHGPTKLYEDLLERALAASDVRGPWKAQRVARRLRATGLCLMCELDLRGRGAGAARPEMLRDGRDPRALQRFAADTRVHWQFTVCGRCADGPSPVRCRSHFLEDVQRGPAPDVEIQGLLLARIMKHLLVYAESFVWGHHGTEGPEDRAALISAVGWCSGWRGLLAALREPR